MKGITFGDPRGGGFKAKIFPYSFHSQGLFIFNIFLKLRFESSENKNPPTLLREYFGFGGERGIRTPGTVSHTAV
jgi:hypothetical protein